MTKEISKREVILKKPFTTEYDVAHVVKEFKVTQYGVHVDDYDFHTSYFDSYNSKAEAEKARESREAWAYKMGDNKNFYVTSREIVVRRFFDIDMQKRIERNRISKDINELAPIAKAKGFDLIYDLLGIGLYYPAKDNEDEDELPPLTEDYAERADKVFYVRLKRDVSKEYLLFNVDNPILFTEVIAVKDFDLDGAHIRWSRYSELPFIYDSKSDWDIIESTFDFEEAPEF